jgi:hypothetical protein
VRDFEAVTALRTTMLYCWAFDAVDSYVETNVSEKNTVSIFRADFLRF